jgi:Ni/Co efflux regulator RcnB
VGGKPKIKPGDYSMKKLLTTVALVALVATPALAQTRDPQTRDRAPTRTRVTVTQPQTTPDQDRQRRSANSSNDVYDIHGQYVGSDPDPTIRSQLANDPSQADWHEMMARRCFDAWWRRPALFHLHLRISQPGQVPWAAHLFQQVPWRGAVPTGSPNAFRRNWFDENCVRSLNKLCVEIAVRPPHLPYADILSGFGILHLGGEDQEKGSTMMMKTLIATVALTAALATPTLAQTRDQVRPYDQSIYGRDMSWYGSWGTYNRARDGRMINRRSSVYGERGNYIGSDPDPTVRDQLRRDPSQGD